MGLAASQARFLAITSRKARCEFESMQMAQQKLSLTRELEQATEDYNSALNTTKLVWDPDGTGATPFDLSYELIMNASEVNDYTPFMISRSDGRIALDSKIARAAKLAGIPEEGCQNTQEMFENFVEAMVVTGGMSEVNAIGVRKVGYQALAGLGGALLDKTQTADMNLGNFINYIDLRAENVHYGVIKDGDNLKFPDDYELLTHIPKINPEVNIKKDHEKYLEDAFYAWNKDHTNVENYGVYPIEFSESLDFTKDSNYLSINGTRVSNKKGAIEYTLSDLLTKDITLAFTKTNKKDDSTRFWKTILGNSNTFLNASTILDGKSDLITMIGVERKLETVKVPDPDNPKKTKEVKGSVYYYDGKELEEDDRIVLDALNNMVTGFARMLNVGDSETETQAFNYAVLETLALLTRRENLGNSNYVSDTYKACIDGSNDYNCWVYKNSQKLNNANTCAISLSSLAESFLTMYAVAQNGFEPSGTNQTPYYIKDSAKDSFYVTDDQGYLYPVQLNEDKETAVDMYNAEYYSIMFNTLCRNGWYENIYIDDEDYLHNALKNGQVFVTTLSEQDGYYYQQRFNNNPYVMEVTDQDAVTRAEREYSKAKSRINYKEEELEIDMKKLDLEISSLTTEYDSVKSMISKNVEKTFSMFQ